MAVADDPNRFSTRGSEFNQGGQLNSDYASGYDPVSERARQTAFSDYENGIEGDPNYKSKKDLLASMHSSEIKTLQYPQQVGSSDFKEDEMVQPHSVVFYIQARTNTTVGRLSKESGTGNTDWIKAQEKLTEQYARENRAKSESADAVAGAGTALGSATLATGVAGKFIGENASALAKPLIIGGAGLVGGATAGFAVDSPELVRLMTTIQLHINNPPSTAYSANYNEESLGVAGQLASGRSSLQDVMSGAEFIGRNLMIGAATLPASMGLGDANFAGALEATTKKVNNPFKEQLFKSMGFRKFQFNYRFNPRNKGEYESVQEIIKQFKFHMHPERQEGEFFLLYPSEFSIEYRWFDQENTHLNRISSCALTDMNITYGGDGFTTIIGTGGAPSEINMTLSFTELETLTNDRIADGY